MNKLLFHVGMGKTGSTAIQWFLARNARKLLRSNIFYPKDREFLVSGAHHPIASLLTETVANGKLTPQHKERIDALLSQYADSGCTTLLLSTEFASRKCPLAIKTLFRDFDVTIIFYLRPQEDFLDSVVNQQVKAYRTRSTSLEVTEEHMSMASYLPLLDAWAKVVGPERVIVRRLGQKNLVGGSLFQDVYSLLGCDVPYAKRDFVEPAATINKSLSKESIEILASMNKYALTLDEHQKLVLYMQKCGEGATTRLLDDEQRQRIRAAFEEENLVIAKKYLGGAGSLF